MEGVTINISNSGLSLHIFNPLREGEKLRILNGGISSRCQFATVQWVRKEDTGIYKAGLMFSQ
jgi:hypothetical protein